MKLLPLEICTRLKELGVEQRQDFTGNGKFYYRNRYDSSGEIIYGDCNNHDWDGAGIIAYVPTLSELLEMVREAAIKKWGEPKFAETLRVAIIWERCEWWAYCEYNKNGMRYNDPTDPAIAVARLLIKILEDK